MSSPEPIALATGAAQPRELPVTPSRPAGQAVGNQTVQVSGRFLLASRIHCWQFWPGTMITVAELDSWSLMMFQVVSSGCITADHRHRKPGIAGEVSIQQMKKSFPLTNMESVFFVFPFHRWVILGSDMYLQNKAIGYTIGSSSTNSCWLSHLALVIPCNWWPQLHQRSSLTRVSLGLCGSIHCPMKNILTCSWVYDWDLTVITNWVNQTGHPGS